MYAKDYFADSDLPADPGLCFVLMPFADEAAERWKVMRAVVSEPPFNLLCRRADDIAAPGHVMTDVLENIGRARLIIADLTGQNPNVFYELGISHTVKEASRVILVASDVDEIPFDLRHLRTVVYSGDHDLLRERIAEVLEQLGVRQYHIDLAEGESGKLPARLTGNDQCLYELIVGVDFLGDDGVKFGLERIRYVAGREPERTELGGHYLGLDQPAMELPDLPWALCYSRADADRARFILGRPPGWVEPE